MNEEFMDRIAKLAEFMHDVYEREAGKAGLEVPEESRRLMLKTAEELIRRVDRERVDVLMDRAQEIDEGYWIDCCGRVCEDMWC